MGYSREHEETKKGGGQWPKLEKLTCLRKAQDKFVTSPVTGPAQVREPALRDSLLILVGRASRKAIRDTAGTAVPIYLFPLSL